MLKTIGLYLSVTLVAWAMSDVHDWYAAREAAQFRPYSTQFVPGPSDLYSPQMQFADYFTPFGGLPPADATTICSSGTSTSLCNPVSSITPTTIAGNANFSGTPTFSTASSLFTLAATTAATIGNTNTFGTTWNCAATAGNSCYTIASDASGSGNVLVLQSPTGAGYSLAQTGSSNHFLQSSGNATAPTIDFSDTNATVATFQNDGTGAAEAFLFNNNNATADAFLGVFQANGGLEYEISKTGDALGNGAHGQTANCSQTVTHSAGTTSTLTLTAWACKLTSSSTASDVTYQLTFPGSVTLTNAPVCMVTSLISGTTISATSSTTQCILTTSAGIGANTAFAFVLIYKNGP